MKKLSKLVLTLGSVILCSQVTYASNQPTTFLGPTLKAGYTSTYNNYSAYSVLGEAGLKNFRLGGTLGWKLEQNQYAKISAEYLWQDVTYHFFSGNTDQWVQQGALGAGYLYEFQGYSYDPHFDLNAYVSHAPSKSLHTVHGTFINSSGVFASFADQRRVAGSNGAGITPALSIAPWQGARAGLGLNYDNVRYNTNYTSNHDAKGFGGTFTFNQVLTQDVDLDLGVAVRQPFNNYTAGLGFANVPYFGKWVLGIDGEYTSGKNTLPNTWNIGLSANYFLDQRSEVAPVYKDQAHYKDRSFKDAQPIRDDLVKYTADPAVYMPQVLAIPDEGFESPDPVCSPVPTLTGVPIPPIDNEALGSTLTVNAGPSFSPSSGLTYTITPSAPLTFGNTLTINPTTGVISAFNGGGSDSITATVTATNACGIAVTSTPVIITYNIG